MEVSPALLTGVVGAVTALIAALGGKQAWERSQKRKGDSEKAMAVMRKDILGHEQTQQNSALAMVEKAQDALMRLATEGRERDAKAIGELAAVVNELKAEVGSQVLELQDMAAAIRDNTAALEKQAARLGGRMQDLEQRLYPVDAQPEVLSIDSGPS